MHHKASRLFNYFRSSSSVKPVQPVSSPEYHIRHGDGKPVSPSAYHIRHEDEEHSLFVIISNTEFLPKTGKAKRVNSEQDVATLQSTFSELGFEVRKHDNQTKNQIEEIMAAGK